MKKVRVIALYLPQFHPIQENDEWWGKGFTEWTNVGRAEPIFKGHYQPRVPKDLGYYDLRIPDVREQQASLARQAGVEGFCYWHYWFGNGKRLMEKIFDSVLESGKPDFPFCLGWANHSWYAKNWNTRDSKKDKLLIEQNYFGKEDYEQHYQYVRRAFLDKRYITIDNKPIFMIFDSSKVPKEMLELWQERAKQDGFNGIYFIGYATTKDSIESKIDYGFSAVCIDRVRDFYLTRKKLSLNYIVSKYGSKFFNYPFARIEYKKLMKNSINENIDKREDVVPFIIPNFDHSPRSGKYGLIVHNSTPELFKDHVKSVFKNVTGKNNNLVILRSWNEWAEGNYMEPDYRFGDGYIKALAECISDLN